MRYIRRPQSLETRAEKYVGKTVKDTKGRWGVVHRAYPNVPNNMIGLWVQASNGSWFLTDNEHATIVKDADDMG